MNLKARLFRIARPDQRLLNTRPVVRSASASRSRVSILGDVSTTLSAGFLSQCSSIFSPLQKLRSCLPILANLMRGKAARVAGLSWLVVVSNHLHRLQITNDTIVGDTPQLPSLAITVFLRESVKLGCFSCVPTPALVNISFNSKRYNQTCHEEE